MRIEADPGASSRCDHPTMPETTVAYSDRATSRQPHYDTIPYTTRACPLSTPGRAAAARWLAPPRFPTRQHVGDVPPTSTCPSLSEEMERNRQVACNAILDGNYDMALRELRRAGSSEACYDRAGAMVYARVPSPQQRLEAFTAALEALERSIAGAREQGCADTVEVIWERYEYCLRAVIWAWEDAIAQVTDAAERTRQGCALESYRAEVQDWEEMRAVKARLAKATGISVRHVLERCTPQSLALIEDLDLVDKALEPADLDALLKALSKALKLADELPLRRLDLSRNRIGDRGLELLCRWLGEHAAQLPLLAVVAVANNDAEVRTEVQLAATLSGVHKRAVIEGEFGAHGDERRYRIARRFIDRKNFARAELAPTPPAVAEGQ